jgi:HAD superfamily hydrolase (TIGR01509 family)
MGKIRGLIFDVDGTIAETERDGHRVAFNRAFAAKGLHSWVWTVDLYGRLLEVTGGKERIQHYAARYQRNFVPPMDWPLFAAELHRLKGRFYRELLLEGSIGLRPGVRRLIQEARESGVRLAIATTSSLENVLPLLDLALEEGSASWFEVIAAGDMVPAKKPAPDIYQYVLREMDLEASDCLVIEDSIMGVRSALATGLKTVVTCNDYTRGQDFRSATLVLDGLGSVEDPMGLIGGTARDRVGSATFFDLALAQELMAQY